MKDDRIYLLQARDALERVWRYTVEGAESFLADAKTQDAVIRNMEVAGESVKRLSIELKEANPDIPWKSIAGMSDKLRQEYLGVDLQLIWKTVESDLPAFRRQIEAILRQRRERR